MQFAGDAVSLTDALFKADVELTCHLLPQLHLIEGNEQRYKRGQARCAEQTGLVIPRRDRKLQEGARFDDADGDQCGAQYESVRF